MRYIIIIIRVTWIALSIVILFFTTYRLMLLDSMRDVSELISIMSYGMMIISFPTGIASFLALMIIGVISSVLGINIENKYIIAALIWIFFLQGGYIQWFVLTNLIEKK
jgi:hypothetical protein